MRKVPTRERRYAGASTLRGASPGFTFLELIIVLAIMSFLFAIGIPSFRHLTPRYQLRSAARSLASTLEHTRLSAMSRGLWMGVHYVITPGTHDEGDSSYYQAIPPAPEDYPEQPVADRKLLPPERLPTGVKIQKVILAGNQVVDRGYINVLFSPMGNSGSHIVVFENNEGMILSMKMSCITGVIDVVEGAEQAFENFVE
jgi:prepilin-type N-terminal cleavage/methylation domain-containing protein